MTFLNGSNYSQNRVLTSFVYDLRQNRLLPESKCRKFTSSSFKHYLVYIFETFKSFLVLGVTIKHVYLNFQTVYMILNYNSIFVDIRFK